MGNGVTVFAVGMLLFAAGAALRWASFWALGQLLHLHRRRQRRPARRNDRSLPRLAPPRLHGRPVGNDRHRSHLCQLGRPGRLRPSLSCDHHLAHPDRGGRALQDSRRCLPSVRRAPQASPATRLVARTAIPRFSATGTAASPIDVSSNRMRPSRAESPPPHPMRAFRGPPPAALFAGQGQSDLALCASDEIRCQVRSIQ